MFIVSQLYIDLNRHASPDLRDLIFAISTGLTGIAIHFFKEIHRIKNSEKLRHLFNSFELLMLISSPTFASFKLLRETYQDPNFNLLIAAIAILVWYVITIIRTNNVEGKGAFAVSSLLYAFFMLAIGITVWMIMLFR